MSDRDPPPPDEEVLLPFTVRRPVAKIGRNDPCHCGSGKKYKRCCLEKDRARLADPSPYRGLTMEEAKREPGRHGDPGIFLEMTPEELDAADKKALASELLLGLFEACMERGKFAAASAALDEIEGRGDALSPEVDLHRDALVYRAFVRGEPDFAREEMARRKGPHTFESSLNLVTSLLAVDRLPDELLSVEAAVRQMLDEQRDLVDLADAVSVGGLPGLAIVITRAAAAIRGDADRAVMEDILYDDRKRLEIDEEDPSLWLLSTGGRPARRRRAEELDQLRARLAERETAISKVRSERDRLAGELGRRTLVEAVESTATPSPQVDDEEARRLKRKVEELQAELRQKQSERQELQRKLRSGEGERSRNRGEAPAPPAADAETGEPLPEDAQVQPVVFTDVFYESVADLDDGRVVLRAQELAVRFAALDPATWKQAKKMQDLDNVFTLRVGIHQRLFLTREAGRVTVRELVSRESFDRVLKLRYRC